MYRTRPVSFCSLVLCGLGLAVCLPAGAQLSFNYTAFDPTNSFTSVAYGISNSGTIVGGAVFNTAPTTVQGYIQQSGVVTKLNYTGAVVGGQTFLLSTNSSGVITGNYTPPGGNQTSFIYNNGSFSTPNDPNAAGGTFFNGVNDAGQVGATYYDAQGLAHGAIYNVNTQTFTNVSDVPSNIGIGGTVEAVAANGNLLENYFTPGNTGYFGVQSVLDANGVYTLLNAPGAFSTHADGINSSGLIAGHYFTGSSTDYVDHGFVYDDGSYYTFDYPGAGATGTEYGINDADQIAGYYADSSGTFHSLLITATPEPGNLAALVGMGVTGTACLLRRRKALRKTL